jgi:TRAP-type C4-dicarboxylate transport system permease small subunit
MNPQNSFWSRLFQVNEISTVIMLSIMVLIVGMNVVLRYVFRTGVIWSEEFVRYAYVWIIFLGSVTAVRDNGHINFNLIVNRLSHRAARIVLCLGDLLVIVFQVILVVYGVQMIYLTRGMTSPVMSAPMPLVYLIFPLSGILTILAMLQLVRDHWKE